jgi:histone H3/H4
MKFDTTTKIILGQVAPARQAQKITIAAESHLVINNILSTFIRKIISGAKKIVRLKNNKRKEIMASDVTDSLQMITSGNELFRHFKSNILGRVKKYKEIGFKDKRFTLANQIKRAFKIKELKMSDEAYVGIAAVIEHTIGDIIEPIFSFDEIKRITPNLIKNVIENDEDLRGIFRPEKFIVPRTVEYKKNELKNRNNDNKILDNNHYFKMHGMFLLTNTTLMKIVKDMGKHWNDVSLEKDILTTLNDDLSSFINNIFSNVFHLYLSYVRKNGNKTTNKVDFKILDHVFTKRKIYIPNFTEAYYKKSVYISPRRFKAYANFKTRDFMNRGENMKDRHYSIMSDDFVRALHLATEHHLFKILNDALILAKSRNNKVIKQKNLNMSRHMRLQYS